ncbi:tRNA dimethylallyltransferase [compost metagenome]
MDRSRLYDRINQRTHQMMAEGLVQEVEALSARYGADLPLLQTLGYAETLDLLAGRATRDEAIAAIQQHTRNYAKRQLTWFRREEGVRWLDGENPAGLFDEAAGLVAKWRA